MSKDTAFVLLTIVFLSVGTASAQTPTGEDHSSARSVVAAHADKAPELDGTLKDSGWQDASLIGNFRQREPFERQPPTERTEVRVLYDSRYLYFGIQCFDSDPTKIDATECFSRPHELSAHTQDLDSHGAYVGSLSLPTGNLQCACRFD